MPRFRHSLRKRVIGIQTQRHKTTRRLSGINATRALLPLMRFNRTKRVMLGLSRLRRYARRQSTMLGGFAGPLHDINSHGADAFGEYAVNCPLIALQPVAARPRPPLRGGVFLEGPPVERLGRRIRL